MNETGYRNLIYLVSKGYLEGFYYKPRIDLDLLRERSEGLIATSGCLSSMVCRAILDGEVETAWRLTEELSRIFPDRFYLEMQRHGIEAQDRVNAELVKMAADLRLPLRRDERRPLPRALRPRAPRRAALHRHRLEPRRPRVASASTARASTSARATRWRRSSTTTPRRWRARSRSPSAATSRSRWAPTTCPSSRCRPARRARRCSSRTPGTACAGASGSTRTSRLGARHARVRRRACATSSR